MAIGDGAEIFLTGTLAVRSDDNVLMAKNATSDLIFDITPGVEITFGKDAQLSGSLTLADAFSNYSDNSNLNTQLFSGAFRSKYDDGKLKMGFNVSYTELNQNTESIRALTRRDVFNTGGNTEVEISQLTSVGAGVTFNHENYKKPGYTDSDSLTVPIDFFYKWTEKTELSVGYRYRDYKVDIGDDSTDHFFNVGARGEFTPKLKGKFAVGLNTRKLDNGGDDTQLGIESSFTYELSPKTNLNFGITNDFGTTPQGAQKKDLSFNGSVDVKLSDEWSVNGGVTYKQTDYLTRKDDYYEGNLGANYTVNAHVKIVGAYAYRNYSSVLKGSEFQNNVFSVAANFRY